MILFESLKPTANFSKACSPAEHTTEKLHKGLKELSIFIYLKNTLIILAVSLSYDGDRLHVQLYPGEV